jgi:hypothetical protein
MFGVFVRLRARYVFYGFERFQRLGIEVSIAYLLYMLVGFERHVMKFTYSKT